MKNTFLNSVIGALLAGFALLPLTVGQPALATPAAGTVSTVSADR